jgi:hypothetical protein
MIRTAPGAAVMMLAKRMEQMINKFSILGRGWCRKACVRWTFDRRENMELVSGVEWIRVCGRGRVRE